MFNSVIAVIGWLGTRPMRVGLWTEQGSAVVRSQVKVLHQTQQRDQACDQ